MAHAIFNVSPVKFLSSIQDHVFTVTPTFKNKSYTNKSDKRKSIQLSQEEQQQQRNSSSASPVTLQLTLPTESTPQMIEIPSTTSTAYDMYSQQLSPSSAVPIDIPSTTTTRSWPLNVSTGDYEGLLSNNNLLSTSYNSHQSFSYSHQQLQQQENNLISLANSISQSPYLPAEDLTVHFDGLAVRSPTGSIYSNNNGLYSPQQINSPINIGSPHSPVYFNGSPQGGNFLAGGNSFVGSPNSPSHFLGSPLMTPTTFNELGIDTTTPNMNDLASSYGGFTYLSPTLQPQAQLSPIDSPSPTGSYVANNNNNNLYLFPPNNNTTTNYSRPSSPVPDDVILTASEVNGYINSPSLIVSSQQQQDNMDMGNNGDGSSIISDLLFNVAGSDTSPLTLDDMELFPTTTNNHSTTTTTSVVTPSSPQQQQQVNTTQPQQFISTAALFFSEDDLEDDDVLDHYETATTKAPTKNRKSTTNTTTPSGRRAKIHKCPYCNHTSNRANNMREHTQIHNPNRPKPHACKLCNRAFARKHDMNRHYISCKKQHSKSNSASYNIMTSPSLDPTTTI